MKKSFLLFLLILASVSIYAIPAKKGLWRTLTLTDGSMVQARLVGDENLHYWLGADGKQYKKSGDAYAEADIQQMRAAMQVRRMSGESRRSARMRKMAPRRNGSRSSVYTGKKRGLVILVQFSDKKFLSGNNKAKYEKILNEEGYTSSEGFVGSVYDYFKAQSQGLFELNFDVAGPVTLSHPMSYYGANDDDGYDVNPGEMVAEACKAVDGQVNFADYDWDGDNEVDQVFILYAGQGEADSGIENTIWPHEWYLSLALENEYPKGLVLDGITIDTYGCSNELSDLGTITGIGTFCHEFSHCLGFPDTYDTEYAGYFGMGSFDLMCAGGYNGDSFCPAGYTAYEKMVCGWQIPTELSTQDVEVNKLMPLSEGGATYIIYNEDYTDEYYLIENRQLTGWDKELPGKGLMITYVDYDLTLWDNNYLNSVGTMSGNPTVKNDHQRLTIFHADNQDDKRYWSLSTMSYSKMTESTDLYPYRSNDSLTATSAPAATLYHAKANGKKLMGKAITNITQNADGSMSFKFRAVDNGTTGGGTGGGTTEKPEGAVFYESFDNCTGTGGNDDLWSGSIASGALAPDNSGWVYENGYGANKCARFGKSGVAGVTSTPAFTVSGTAVLTFKAAAWVGKDGVALGLSVDNGTVSPSSFTMKQGEWTDYTATITATGPVTLKFSPSTRMFLDEVLAVDPAVTAVLDVRPTDAAAMHRIYTIDGRYAGTDMSTLRPGLYIINGKKVIK